MSLKMFVLFQDVKERIVRDKKHFLSIWNRGLLLSAYFWLIATCSCYVTETCPSPCFTSYEAVLRVQL